MYYVYYICIRCIIMYYFIVIVCLRSMDHTDNTIKSNYAFQDCEQ